MRLQQIENLAEELRQTSLKNVKNESSKHEESRKVQQRLRRPSGQWKITSVSIEESKANLDYHDDHCHKFERGEFAFQQNEVGMESSVYSGMENNQNIELNNKRGISVEQSNAWSVNDLSRTENQIGSQRDSTQVNTDSMYQESYSFQQTQNKIVNRETSQYSRLDNNQQNGFQSRQRRNSSFSQSNMSSVENYSNTNENISGKDSTKYIPSFLSLLPKPREDPSCSQGVGFPSGRRNSISCLGSGQSSSHSRASSVDRQQRPVFSFLKNSDENPHRTRQPSNLASRRNSVVGLQKYSSQEYLNSGANSNLKIRNNPIMLAQPKNNIDKDDSSMTAKDGTLYQSTESLNCFKSRSRSRHSSGTQNKDLYTWNGRNSLQGTGLRVGSAVTEPEPRDGLALSKDGGFFMPFGNTENLNKKCKTRRQLKAEEQLRRQQEEEEEKQQRIERERRKMERKEKRNRNRTMSMSSCNRSQLGSSVSTNITNNVEINSKENLNIIEKNVVSQNNNFENNSVQNVSNKITTEIENIEILTKASEKNAESSVETDSKTDTNNNESDELSRTERERDTSWQKFGAEYNEFGELISCGKEPLGKKDGFLLDYEKRDRSNAFWQVGEDYEGLVDGYGNRSEGQGVTRNRWDNVQRGPVLHTQQNPDFVPDRSGVWCPHNPSVLTQYIPSAGVL